MRSTLGVNAAQACHQHPVEDGGHAFAQEDWDRDEVSGQANRSNDDLKQI